MSVPLYRSGDFNKDFDLQYRWYLEVANEEVAERFLNAVLATLELLERQPEIGRCRKFRDPALRDIRSFRVVPPYGTHVIFYRSSAAGISAERVMHGARDLPRRLKQQPGNPG